MKISFTEFTNQTNWVTGIIYTKTNTFIFEAKLFDVGSEFGIDCGRVSKLQVWDKKIREEENLGKATIFNYDRGWDIKPKKENKEIFTELLSFLEKAPKRFT